jgi:bacterioferritin
MSDSQLENKQRSENPLQRAPDGLECSSTQFWKSTEATLPEDAVATAQERIAQNEPAGKDSSSAGREKLIKDLNEDLAREYQAIIAYVVYSQVLKGAEYMNIARELETHAGQELQHALIISKQIDYLGGMPVGQPKPVVLTDDNKEMLRADLRNETETIRNYRERVRQCESLGEYAMAEAIRQILVQEQEHQIDLATALGIEVPRTGNETGTGSELEPKAKQGK